MENKLSKILLFITLVFCSNFYFSCKPNSESTSIKTIWFGGYELLDPLDIKSCRPLYNYIELVNDSLLTLYLDNEIVDSVKNEHTQKKFTIDNDVLTLYNDFKFTSAINCSSSTNKFFQNKLWANEDFQLYLTDSTLFLKKTKEALVVHKCVKWEKISGLIFLSSFGNKWVCDEELPYFQYQIVQKNKKSICLKGFFDGGFKTIEFNESDKEYDDNLTFTLCNDLFNINYPENRYSYTKARYKGGIYSINKQFKEKYKTPNKIKESGLIRIRFTINCKGETGMFEMLELDDDYKKKSFDKKMSTQLLSICKDLNEWIPGYSEGKNVDSYKFITFKIKDSEIIEIFP